MNVASLVDRTLFEYFYAEAAKQAGELDQYEYNLDPDALELAGSKFISDYLAIDPVSFEARSWEVQVSIVINLLVRATAAFPIINYKRPKVTEKVSPSGEMILTSAFNSRITREKTNALVAFVFAARTLSMELSNFLRSQGLYSANIDALKEVRTSHKTRYITIFDQDSRKNYSPSRNIRSDFRVTWAIKALLMRGLTEGFPT